MCVLLVILLYTKNTSIARQEESERASGISISIYTFRQKFIYLMYVKKKAENECVMSIKKDRCTHFKIAHPIVVWF